MKAKTTFEQKVKILKAYIESLMWPGHRRIVVRDSKGICLILAARPKNRGAKILYERQYVFIKHTQFWCKTWEKKRRLNLEEIGQSNEKENCF